MSGEPFRGPAGLLLDRMISEAIASLTGVVDVVPRLAFTNLICCIPRWDEARGKRTAVKVSEPPRFAVEACAPRLLQFLALARPRMVFAVGDHSQEWVPKLTAAKTRGGSAIADNFTLVPITHPAAILRADQIKQGIMYQRAVVTISDALGDPFSS